MDKESPPSLVTCQPKVPDGGWGWVIVFCSFMIHFIMVGTAFSLSVLFVDWVEEFETTRGLMSWVISVMSAVMFGIGPIPANLASRWGYRTVVIIGGFTASVGFALGHLATNVYMLIICIGLIAGTGCGLCYLPAIAMVAQYFDKKRSVAIGMASAGVGIGAFVIAPIFHLLTQHYGWRGTLLIISGVFLNLCVFGMLMRPLGITEENVVIEGEECQQSLLTEEQVEELNKIAFVGRTEVLITGDDGSATDGVMSNLKDKRLPQTKDEPLICVNEKDTNLFRDVQGTPASTTETYLSDMNGTVVINGNHQHLLTNLPLNPCSARNGLSLQHLNEPKEHVARQFSSHCELRPRKLTSGSLVTLPENASISRLDLLMSGSIHSLSAFTSHKFNFEGKAYTLHKNNHFNQEGGLDTPSSTSELNSKDSNKNPSFLSSCCRAFFATFEGFLLLKDFVFLMFVVSNILTNLSFLMPVLFMVDRAIDNGIDKRSAAILVSVNGVGNVFGRIFFGFLADRNIMDRIWWYIFCLTVCGLATCFSPLCGDNVVLHAVFAFTFGCFIGAYTTLAPVVTVDLVGVSVVGQAYGVVLLFMGIAGVIGPPLAGSVFDLTGNYTASFVLHGAFIVISAVVLIPVIIVKKRRSRKQISRTSF